MMSTRLLACLLLRRDDSVLLSEPWSLIWSRINKKRTTHRNHVGDIIKPSKLLVVNIQEVGSYKGFEHVRFKLLQIRIMS